MEINGWYVIIATLAGPILAVQAQKFIEVLRERRNRKTSVFAQLMATRAARLSPEHVQALNMIDIVFYGRTVFGIHRRSRRERAVLDAWKEYHDNLGEGSDWPEAQQQAHYAKRDELFLNLLHAISQDVGFSFDRVQLKRGAYSPIAHEQLEIEQRAIRQVLIRSLSGEAPLKMEIVRVPFDQVAAERSQQSMERIAEALEKQAAQLSSE